MTMFVALWVTFFGHYYTNKIISCGIWGSHRVVKKRDAIFWNISTYTALYSRRWYSWKSFLVSVIYLINYSYSLSYIYVLNLFIPDLRPQKITTLLHSISRHETQESTRRTTIISPTPLISFTATISVNFRCSSVQYSECLEEDIFLHKFYYCGSSLLWR
jgi:hypothetical protein